jgi:hypothetical protein
MSTVLAVGSLGIPCSPTFSNTSYSTVSLQKNIEVTDAYIIRFANIIGRDADMRTCVGTYLGRCLGCMYLRSTDIEVVTWK